METIRVGIIGAGWVVQNRHLPGLEGVPGVQLARIWSRDGQKARRLAEGHGIAHVAESWQEVIDATDVDAVIVATPPVLHAAASIAALRAGKHVLCQGRMARNLREADHMLAASRETDRVAALYPPRPGLKGDRVMRRLLHEEGYVGQIREVRVTSVTLSQPPSQYRWTDDPDVVGVHAMTMGLWAEVLDRWVGPAALVSAFCQTHVAQRLAADGQWVPAQVPDSLSIVAELRCGATASYHFSSQAAFGPGHSIAIYGSRGALVYDMFPDHLRGATGGEKEMHDIEIPDGEIRHHTTDAEFIDAIRSGTPVSPDFRGGRAYMAFCEAVAWSCHTGVAVDVASLQPAMASWGKPL